MIKKLRLVLAGLVAGLFLLHPHNLSGAASWGGQATRPEVPLIQAAGSGSLFENVVAVLEKRYYDAEFKKEVLPGLVNEYRKRASRAGTPGQQRQVVHDLLSNIPASHLGLLSSRGHQAIMNELIGRRYFQFGFQLVEIKGKHYAFMVLEGGPAARAGLLPWDRIAAIDGVKIERSPRLDWRSDDAYIEDDRDPPVRMVLAKAGDKVELKIERKPGRTTRLTVEAQEYSAFEAARAGARILESEGRRFGYIHFWLIHMSGVPELLKEKLEGQFADCDGLVLDLRGRGGNGQVIPRILAILRGESSTWRKPVVALVDRQSRSAKDVIAYELRRTKTARLVGEKTAGAVIPATFANVGHETVLMFPSYKLPRYTDVLELKPVEPDVYIERAGPYSAGDDPILKAGVAEGVRLAKSVGVNKGAKIASAPAR